MNCKSGDLKLLRDGLLTEHVNFVEYFDVLKEVLLVVIDLETSSDRFEAGRILLN